MNTKLVELIINNWTEVLFTFVSSLFTFMIKQYVGIKMGMKSLLKNEIIRTYETYIKLGYCPSFIKENIKEIYESYHKLKGNGMGTSMVNELYKLPNEPKERK